MTWSRAKEYVEELAVLGVRLGLERISALAAALGDPQLAYRTIHVVGTNGKSSTTRFLASVLREHGFRVGAYISPHLVGLGERQMVNGVPSSDADFYALVERIRLVAESVNATLPGGEALTQFEVLTAAALLYFAEQECEVVVVEAGLGGRHDATNIIRSEVQVLTTIGLEHTAYLGDTTAQILEEKAAVIREGGRVAAGILQPQIKDRLREIAAERRAELRLLDEDASLLCDKCDERFDIFGLYDLYGDLSLSVLGAYQRDNAALAVMAAELFMGKALDIEKVRRGLLETRVPGRLEVISTQPLCIFDGAHNPSGMAEMTRSLDELLNRRRLIAVVSILKDKGAEEMLQSLASRCDIVFVTRSSSPRAYEPEDLAPLLQDVPGGPQVFIDPSPRSALFSAYRLATSNQVVLVTGSLYLIADLKRELGSRGGC